MKRSRLRFRIAGLMILIAFAAIPMAYYAELVREQARREAESLARSERLGGAYVLYQPYTFQSNQPFGQKNPSSWTIGVTVR